jgi:hypothetical protein
MEEQMKSLKTLWRVAADELSVVCHTSAIRDYKTVSDRIENEGLSFLTITLPAFAKDFERSLETGLVDSSYFVGFQRSKGPLPVFLGGFLSQIFDLSSGHLLSEPNIDCILAIRQLTTMFGKILIPCSDARNRGAIKGYIQCEQEIQESAVLISESDHKSFSRIAALLFADVFSELENKLDEEVLVPRHGPGSTADKLRGNSKFDQREWPLRLERVFPFGEYALPSWRFYNEIVGEVDFLEPGQERPVEVVLVPKTLKTPRIIAIEPTCMQYMQQALSNEFVALLENDRIGRNARPNVICGQIGFSDQMPNRHLAREGSLNGSLATLDLSEASDRVSVEHVFDLTLSWPLLYEALMATRSEKAQVPGHGIITISKFASMGSALCFPIEAMVFLTVVYFGIEQELKRPLTRHDVKSMAGSVRVYGDDIIVPVDYVYAVISALELFGFKINANKSFWNGKFRESCGGDYYDGHDVTPVKVRRKFPTSLRDVEEVQSLVALRNLFYTNGLWKTARHLDLAIGKVLPHFPVVESTSSLLGRHSFLPYQGERECPKLHRPLVRGFKVSSKPPPSRVSGLGALQKWFLKQGEEPFADKDHLLRQGRPVAVDIKLRWMPPF